MSASLDLDLNDLLNNVTKNVNLGVASWLITIV